MAGPSQEYRINIKTAADTSGVSKVEGALKGLSGVAGSLVAGVGLAAVTGFLQQSAAAAFESEAANVRLAAALQNTGQESSRALGSIGELASEYEALTNVSDEAFTRAAATLVQFGAQASEIPELFPILEGLAGRMGGDVEQAAQLLGRALAGNTRQLAQFGIRVQEGATKLEILKAVTEAAAKGQGILRAQAESTEGRLKNLSNAYDRLKEAIGAQLTEGGQLSGQVDVLAKSLDWAATNADIFAASLKTFFNLKGLFTEAGGFAQQLETAMEDGAVAAEKTKKAVGNINAQPLEDAADAAGRLAGEMKKAEDEAVKLFGQLQNIDQLQNDIAEVVDTPDQKEARLAQNATGAKEAFGLNFEALMGGAPDLTDPAAAARQIAQADIAAADQELLLEKLKRLVEAEKELGDFRKSRAEQTAAERKRADEEQKRAVAEKAKAEADRAKALQEGFEKNRSPIGDRPGRRQRGGRSRPGAPNVSPQTGETDFSDALKPRIDTNPKTKQPRDIGDEFGLPPGPYRPPGSTGGEGDKSASQSLDQVKTSHDELTATIVNTTDAMASKDAATIATLSAAVSKIAAVEGRLKTMEMRLNNMAAFRT